MIEIREEMADELEEALDEVLDQFFLRHVETRWLQAAPCIDRILKHWASTVEYFRKYIPNSTLANNKNAVLDSGSAEGDEMKRAWPLLTREARESAACLIKMWKVCLKLPCLAWGVGQLQGRPGGK